jgi:hypothetical protein
MSKEPTFDNEEAHGTSDLYTVHIKRIGPWRIMLYIKGNEYCFGKDEEQIEYLAEINAKPGTDLAEFAKKVAENPKAVLADGLIDIENPAWNDMEEKWDFL